MNTKLWWVLTAAVVWLLPHKAMADACTSARFHFWNDMGCNANNSGLLGMPQANCPDCATNGMPRWWVSQPYIDLWMSDTPLSYTTSSGQKMDFTFYYKQGYTMPAYDEIPSCPLTQIANPHMDGYFRTLSTYGYCMTNAFWGNNWMASLFFFVPPGSETLENGYQVLYFNPKGGINYFYITNYYAGFTDQPPYSMYVTNSCLRDPASQIQIQPLSALGYPTAVVYSTANGIYWGDPQTNGFALLYPDGSRDLFGLIPYEAPNGYSFDNPGGYYALLTQKIDPQGRITRIGYSYTNGVVNGLRVCYVVDPDGRTNTFKYPASVPANAVNSFIPSEIDDPYGRKITLSCDPATGLLTNIVDAAGLTNSFAYQGTNTGWITNLSTPYGNTSFSYFQDADPSAESSYIQRAMYVSEPEGAQQLYYFLLNNGANWPASGTSPTNIPGQSFDDGTGGSPSEYQLYWRNTYHWGRRQFASLSSGVQTNIISSLSTALNNLQQSDYYLAVCDHWLLNSNVLLSITEGLSSEQDPSPDAAGQISGLRTWYNYPGKYSAEVLGGDPQVSCIARILPDGTDQYTTYNYFPSTYTNGGAGLASDNETTFSLPNGAIGLLTNRVVYSTNNVDFLSSSNSYGQYVQYGYNAIHQVVATTNALGQVTTYGWDGTTHNLTNIVYPGGKNVAISYYATSSAPSATSAMISQINIQPEGRSFAINNYSAGLLSSVTDDRGLAVTNTWDGLNRLTSTVFPDGTSISNVYFRLDKVAAQDRLTNWTYFGYDGLQHLVAVTNANNAVTYYSYCGCGSLSMIVDALTNTTYFNYDNQGNLTNEVFPDTSSLTWTYDLAGRMTNVVDGAGRYLELAYNNQGLPIATTNANGPLEFIIYDAMDRPVSVTDANGITVTNQYDAINELLQRTWPDNVSEGYGYSAAGLIASTNRDGKATYYTLDGAGRKIAETNANQEVTRFAYDSLDNITNLWDGNTNQTSWQYNQYGWLTNKTDALGRNAFRYAYNPNGWLTNRVTPEKGATAYTYDNVGNLKSILYPQSSILYAYDALNRLTNMVDASGTNNFTYTPMGQLASESNAWAGVAYSYAQGLRMGMTLNSQPSTLNFSYSYDAGWRMTNATSPAGAFAYAYAANVGQSVPAASILINSITLPNGASVTNSYDALARLNNTALNNHWGHTLDGYTYTLDPLGLRTNILRNLGLSSSTVSVGYDNIGQIISWLARETNGTARQNEQLAFAYDPAHNLHSRTNGGLAQIFIPDAANQLTNVSRSGTFTLSGATPAPATNITVNGSLAQAYGDFTFADTNHSLFNGQNIFTNIAANVYGLKVTNTLTLNLPQTVSLSYDNNGNITNDGVRVFAYDSENQLTNVFVASNWQSSFIYDGLNRRRIERDYNWNGSTWVKTNEVRYICDGLLPVQERDTNNNVLVTYTRGLDLSGSLSGAGGIGGLLARTDANGSTFYHADGNGNITALMDGSENIAGRYLYNPFGKLVGIWGPMAGVNEMRFSSMPYYSNSGIYGYWGRFFDPNLQRWLHQDPIQETGGVNLYQFAGNNPVNEVDPFGLLSADRASEIISSTMPPLGWDWSSYKDQRTGLLSLANQSDDSITDLSKDYYDTATAFMGPGEVRATCSLGAAARSKFPIGARKMFNTMNKAYDAAKKAGNGNEPVKHPPNETQPPHFHPGDGNGRPANHDHYNFPPRYW